MRAAENLMRGYRWSSSRTQADHGFIVVAAMVVVPHAWTDEAFDPHNPSYGFR